MPRVNLDTTTDSSEELSFNSFNSNICTLNWNSISNVKDISLKVSINWYWTKKELVTDINLHKCVCMELLYPLLKVMPDAPIVLQVKDSRERQKHPLWMQKRKGKMRASRFLCFTFSLSRSSLSAPFSPLGSINGEGLSPPSEIPTGSRSSVLFPSALHVPNDFKQTHIHKHT